MIKWHLRSFSVSSASIPRGTCASCAFKEEGEQHSLCFHCFNSSEVILFLLQIKRFCFLTLTRSHTNMINEDKKSLQQSESAASNGQAQIYLLTEPYFQLFKSDRDLYKVPFPVDASEFGWGVLWALKLGPCVFILSKFMVKTSQARSHKPFSCLYLPLSVCFTSLSLGRGQDQHI